MHISRCIFKHHTMESYWREDISFNEFLSLTLDRAGVVFHPPVSLFSRKESP